LYIKSICPQNTGLKNRISKMKKKEEGRCQVEAEIFGQRYQFSANSDPDYLQHLACEVDKRMKAIADENPHLGPQRVAVLTLLELAADINNLQKMLDKQEQSLTSRCLEIEQDIERLLGVA
jgi:cell division protein ZapA (FtsZ GTPase activity inhibitor)